MFDIDSTLRIEETTQAQIRQHSALIEFMNIHCRARAYSFQACITNLLQFELVSYVFIKSNAYF